ncbi:MAG: DUF2189 domain-containing protein [Gammaproteobacteria bacterium]|nr:DUF2189 domain-containing protein [Gammaproteobacteria bacterium]MCK9506107.1 DUF2189 domain-containing protein [Porticoccaceae bacterium]
MTLLVSKTGIEVEIPKIQRVAGDAPYRWLRQGWADVKINRLLSIGIGVLYVAVGYLVSYVGWQAPWALMTIGTGFVLVAPVLAIGFYGISRAHEQNKVPTFAQAWRYWRGNGLSVFLYGMMLLLVLFFWSWFNWLTTVLVIGVADGMFVPSLEVLLFSSEGWALIAMYAGMGLLVAIAVFSGSVVTLQMMMDRNIDPVTAVVASVSVVRQNKRVMAKWAVIIFGLTAFGIATAYLGLILIFPLLGHASWHAYRELVT